MATQQIVKNEGIYHGIPTYPDEPEFKDLTAIVTGANGMHSADTKTERWLTMYVRHIRLPHGQSSLLST
jgi:hypothetical protein